ncbi:zinc-dependent alcohol dehydrogenase [Nocardia gipuzkoensis]|uniref:zinc-dependent alcohol dehydrogenase n=1 Tax=Nocardia gipuzkoensis TaxID=2749991 RepID=UPI0015EE42B1|nr:alcohol dehydrogenase catalytic domain-containing protein [Nocardia gipuzkoensis]
MTATGRPSTGHWPTGMMRASVITAPEHVRLVEVPIPDPVPGHVLVRVARVGLCGTDSELLRGAARYIRDGRSTFPLRYGHEWAGVVEAVCGVDSVLPGDRVVGQTMIWCGSCRGCQTGRRNECTRMVEVGLYGCAGAAAHYVRVPATALTVLPATVDADAAVLIEPAVTVLAGIDALSIRHSDTVMIIGTGTIGLLALQMLKGRVARLSVIGIDENGLELAGRLGASDRFDPAELEEGSYSVVIEASGSPEALAMAIRGSAVGARIAAIGISDEIADGIDVNKLVLAGLSIRGIRHGLDYYPDAVGLFGSGSLDAHTLIDRVEPLEHAALAFAELAAPRRAPKILLDPWR